MKRGPSEDLSGNRAKKQRRKALPEESSDDDSDSSDTSQTKEGLKDVEVCGDASSSEEPPLPSDTVLSVRSSDIVKHPSSTSTSVVKTSLSIMSDEKTDSVGTITHKDKTKARDRTDESSSGEEPELPADTSMMLSYEDDTPSGATQSPAKAGAPISKLSTNDMERLLLTEGDSSNDSSKIQASMVGKERKVKTKGKSKNEAVTKEGQESEKNRPTAGPEVVLDGLKKSSKGEVGTKKKRRKRKYRVRNRADKDPSITTSDLSTLVFGSGDEGVDKFEKEITGKYGAEFCEDFSGDVKESVEEHKPAWEDDDDNILVNIAERSTLRKLRTHQWENIVTGKEYERRVREKFKEIMPTVDWKEDADDLSKQQSEDIAPELRPTFLRVTRKRDLNIGNWHKSVVTAVDFHPHDNLILTAGLDKHLKLFQNDGKTTSLLESIYLSDLPIRNAKFTADGRDIIMAGRKTYFYTFELATSKVTKVFIRGNRGRSREYFWITPDNKYIVFSYAQGAMLIVDRSSQRLVKTLKMSGGVRAICFGNKGAIMYAAGTDAEIYEFSLETFRCVRKRQTECTGIQAMNQTEEFLIVGGPSGIVSIIPKKLVDGKPIQAVKSIKVFGHLTTPVTTIQVNPGGTMMLIASKYKKDAVRMVNLKENVVYWNWPGRHGFRHVLSAAFSPNNHFFALGRDTGKVALFLLE